MFEYDLEYVDTVEIPLFIPANIAAWINVYKEIARCSNIFPAFENIVIPEKFSYHVSCIHRFGKKSLILIFFLVTCAINAYYCVCHKLEPGFIHKVRQTHHSKPFHSFEKIRIYLGIKISQSYTSTFPLCGVVACMYGSPPQELR